MSNLPHPLGDSSTGDLFYPGSPTVTVADAPGAAGSRAVEYGEDGYSSAINRGLYALGKNEEYIQERMEAPVAKLTTTAFTPSGGNGDSYTFTGVNLFVGDTSYLPESQAMRNSLITVLDSNFNELIDSSDNRVVVKEIRNAADSASIVGDQSANGGDDDGFYNSGAIVRFKTIDPTSGTTVNSSYTIPDGTAVYLAHCTAGTMDTLATSGSEHLMRDGWGKLRPVSLAQLPAYGFAIDGSRKMRGDIDMNGNLIDNASALQGQSGADLSIQSLQDLLLKDQYATAGIKLAQSGQTALYSPSTSLTSLAGVLNSQARLTEKLVGNRVVVRGGDVTFTDASGAVTLPGGMAVVLNGEYIAVSGSFTATADADKAGVIQSDGSFVEKDLSAVAATDLLVTVHYWSSTGPAFTTKLDARWVTGRPTDVRAITVGDTQGADFTDLQDAINFTTALYNVSTVSGVAPLPVPIQIVGEITLSASVTLPDIPMRIRGDNRDRAVIKVSSAFPTSANVIEGNYQKSLLIENITFYWDGAADQDTGTCVLNNLGANSIVRNIKFTGNGSFEFARGLSWSTAIDGVVVEHCEADALSEEAIVGTDVTNARVNNTHLNSATSSSDWAISLGAGARIRDCQIGTGAASPTYGIRVLRGSKVEGCHIKLASTAAGRGVLMNWGAVTGPFKAKFALRDCVIENGDTSVRFEGSTTDNVEALVVGISTVGAASHGVEIETTALGDYSKFTIRSCTITNCDRGVDVSGTSTAKYHVVVDDCDIISNTRYGVVGTHLGQLTIDRSRFYGFGTAATSAAVWLAPTAATDEYQRLRIDKCYFEAINGTDHSASLAVRVNASASTNTAENVTITNSTVRAAAGVYEVLEIYETRHLSIDNCDFYDSVKCILTLENGTLNDASEKSTALITNNRFHAFNYTADLAERVLDIDSTQHITIKSNKFFNCPQCIEIENPGTENINNIDISHNMFDTCGVMNSSWATAVEIIRVWVGATIYEHNVSVVYNKMHLCGPGTGFTHSTTLIDVQTHYFAEVSYNQIYNSRFHSNSVSATFNAIHVNGVGDVSHNKIYLYTGNKTSNAIRIIDFESGTAHNNTIQYYIMSGGSITAPSIYGIVSDSNGVVVTGNRVHFGAGWSNDTAIRCAGDEIVCNSNYVRNSDLVCPGGSGMCACNVSINSAVNAGTHATTGNV